MRVRAAAMSDDVVGIDQLTGWVEDVAGGRITARARAAGGNRCHGWRLGIEGPDGERTVFLRYQAFAGEDDGPYSIHREAELYTALRDSGVPVARLIARHDRHPAMLLECLEGSGGYRQITDEHQRAATATGAIRALAALHAVDAARLDLPSFGGHSTIDAAVRAELGIWWQMYLDTGRTDPLIELGHRWLLDHIPPVDTPPVIVHGDAGPGNFMFEGNRLTGLIDWELAHLGDPMEDIAWFSMRSVLEPVPDFPALVRAYAAASPQPVDFDRIRYHRIFVAWRVVIIRHCDVSGAVGASILTRTLNRRLLVDAIAQQSGIPAVPPAQIEAPPGRKATEYDRILDVIRDDIVPHGDAHAATRAKDMARAVKYLRQVHLIGAEAEAREIAFLDEVLGETPKTVEAGRTALAQALRAGTVGIAPALAFAQQASALQSQLASDAMGALAKRHFPPLED